MRMVIEQRGENPEVLNNLYKLTQLQDGAMPAQLRCWRFAPRSGHARPNSEGGTEGLR
jgi:hypothetical protein